MVDIDQIAARVKAQCPGLRYVGTALDYADVAAEAVQVDSAFVVPMRESAGPSLSASDLVVQRIDAPFAVILAVQHVRGQRQAHTPDRLQPLRKEVRTALLGFSLGGRFSDVAFDSGELSAVEPGVVWWTDIFSTTYMENSNG